MSGTKIIRSLMGAHAPLISAVPLARIIAGVIPKGTALPCIGLTTTSGVDRNIVKAGSTRHVTERIQITVIAQTYAQQKSVMDLARKACADKIGTIAGIDAVTVHTEGRGGDFNDASAGFYMQTQDFVVGFQEAT